MKRRIERRKMENQRDWHNLIMPKEISGIHPTGRYTNLAERPLLNKLPSNIN